MNYEPLTPLQRPRRVNLRFEQAKIDTVMGYHLQDKQFVLLFISFSFKGKLFVQRGHKKPYLTFTGCKS